MSKQRLTENDVQTIVALLEVWEGPLTWDLLVKRAAVLLGRAYSRQAFDAHEAIKATYQARKRRNRAIRDSVKIGQATSDEIPAELALALQRAEAAEIRIKAMEQIIEGYRMKFVCWLFNARNFGMSEDHLNAPLPASDQESGALWSRSKAKR